MCRARASSRARARVAHLERGRLRDRLALVRLVHERLRVARVGHAAGAELALALVLLGLKLRIRRAREVSGARLAEALGRLARS